MLVRIDDNRVGLVDYRIGAPRRLVERIGNQPEVAAIGPIGVHAKSIALAQRQNLRQRIDGAHRSCTHRCNHRPHITLPEFDLERIQIHASSRVRRDHAKAELQNRRDAAVCIVRLPRRNNPLSRSQLSRHPQGLKICDRSTRG